MKHILVLGAGLVARPLVRYFLERSDTRVELADIEADRAESLVAGHPRGRAVALDIEDDEALSARVAAHDLVVSFVPYAHHPRVARHCLDRGRHLVTASYVSPAMRALDGEAKAKGLVFLNEAGLDPGLDHMEAMRIIDGVHGRGASVTEFISYCGGLPAPESNTNPFGYKFSWSPVGVLMASQNPAKFLWEGEEVALPSDELFDKPARMTIPGVGTLEGYPNRDSLSYLGLYGLQKAKTILRGTLRYPGWCRTMKRVKEFGLLDGSRRDRSGHTLRDFTAASLGLPPGASPRAHLEERYRDPEDAKVLDRLAWLGLFGDRPLPAGEMSGLEIMAALMTEAMSYRAGERDMVVLQHRLTVRYPGGEEEIIFSTLVDYGRPGGDSAMARTVALPAASCARLILEGRVREAGVIIPVLSSFYAPVLAELAGQGIVFLEQRKTLPASG